ncbi:YfcC family protein [Mucilaginibacter myungsuensis]|uniref:YfcC family protein n=1 Tax=Mucilaginibacter myungsuensis TaxID=649104 RepID=A0A929PYZ2_9SPHI|nr:YfcC family protein [Mucilaginibacter myungsuensis]MBE9663847.1 YfcC family protein [Mucilaginibacter myungsuensis]MDN3598438.1 YfcC family protein [Mucilaginibacter myungsuensis]
MAKLKKLPSPISILVIVILLAAAATWLLPSGEYDKLSYADKTFSIASAKGNKVLPATQHTLDSLGIRIPLAKFTNGDIRKPVAVPGSYHQLPSNKQGPAHIIQAPIKGIYETIDIILFILFIGGFMHVFQKTGAMEQGIRKLSHRMKGREAWLIIIMTTLFAAGGSSFGMAEECLIFYPVMVPLFLAAGYDLLVPVATVMGGACLGNISSFSNPFATIIASNAAGINWADGLIERLGVFVAVGFVYVWYVVRYAQKVQRDPTASLVYQIDGAVASPFAEVHSGPAVKLSGRHKILLTIFFFTFAVMIGGVMALEWWLPEMSALFLVSAIIVAVITRTNESVFIGQFIDGARELLGVAFIIGVARGVGLILNEGRIADSILYYSSGLVGNMPPLLFVLILFGLYLVFTLFISSSSGMAVLTMPIFGSMAVMAGAPGREVVNAYLFGMGIMGFLTPTGLLLPTLALVNISYKTWLKFIWPVLLMLILMCCLFLIGGALIA